MFSLLAWTVILECAFYELGGWLARMTTSLIELNSAPGGFASKLDQCPALLTTWPLLSTV